MPSPAKWRVLTALTTRSSNLASSARQSTVGPPPDGWRALNPNAGNSGKGVAMMACTPFGSLFLGVLLAVFYGAMILGMALMVLGIIGLSRRNRMLRRQMAETRLEFSHE